MNAIARTFDTDFQAKPPRMATRSDRRNNIPRMVGNSPAMENIDRLVNLVSATDTSVLILGESGTGKEVIARNIHGNSERSRKPFVPINCGAIPEELLESELFGHEKGAFTGAVRSRPGRFEMAKGGTLFLDEIGDMPLHMQVKLLRVLQEKTFERVGGEEVIHADVRIIAATHQNLEQLVEEGKFRMDLFYRLNVFPIEIPALRDRSEDIPLLIEELGERLFKDTGVTLNLSDCVVQALAAHHWPGNVRELFNLMERLAILHPEGVVKTKDLPCAYRPVGSTLDFSTGRTESSELVHKPLELIPESGIDLKDQLRKIEISLIWEALETSDWVVAHSAKMLNLQRTTLVEKMRKYSICRLSPA